MRKIKKEENWVIGLVSGKYSTHATKGALTEKDRNRRVQYVLSKYGMTDLSTEKILRYAKLENISIDQIEKRIVRPLADLRDDNPKEYANQSSGLKGGLGHGKQWFIALLIAGAFWFFVVTTGIQKSPFQ